MAYPVQIWVPWFHWGLVGGRLEDDLQRAQSGWTNEDRVWCLKDLREPFRYNTVLDLKRFYRAQPTNEDNYYHVVNVNRRREAHFPDFMPPSWGGKIPEGLYRQWLNTEPQIVKPGTVVESEVPLIRDGLLVKEGESVLHEKRKLNATLGMYLMADEIDPVAGRIGLGLPPADPGCPPCVGALMQGARFYATASPGTLTLGDTEFEILGFPSTQHKVAVKVALDWPEPFNFLFHDGGGADVFLHHKRFMRGAAKLMTFGHSDEARRIAEAWVGRLTRDVEISLHDVWNKSFLERRGHDWVVADMQEDFDIPCSTWGEVQAHPRYAALKTKRIPVRRINSWLGYFWWELLQDLRGENRIAICERCGYVFAVQNRRKQFCGEEDSRACFLERSRRDQRKSRMRARLVNGLAHE